MASSPSTSTRPRPRSPPSSDNAAKMPAAVPGHLQGRRHRGAAGDLGEQGRLRCQDGQVQRRRQGRGWQGHQRRDSSRPKSAKSARTAAVATTTYRKKSLITPSHGTFKSRAARPGTRRPRAVLGSAIDIELREEIPRCCATCSVRCRRRDRRRLPRSGRSPFPARCRRARSAPTRPISTTARPCSSPAAARPATPRPGRTTRRSLAAGSG